MEDLSNNLEKTFVCNFCNYSTKILFNWHRHLDSNRHQKCEQNNLCIHKLKDIETKCETCGKQYTTKTGLAYHQSRCKQTLSNEELIQMLIKNGFNINITLTPKN